MKRAIISMRSPLAHIALLAVVVVSFSFIPTSNGSTTCDAQGSCPEPAVNGRQPFPRDLWDAFDRAGINRLGADGPTLPRINKGYPQFQAIEPYVPCILLKAVGYTESKGWKQFNAEYGQNGATVISFDCGYGIMQITNAMDGSGTFDPARVAAEPRYNIGTGARFLIEKWNAVPQAIGTNDPYTVEDWYYAVWAYNGFGWVNNPNRTCPDTNPTCSYAFNPLRPPFDGTQPKSWYPYQELVWGYAAHPPSADFWDPVALTLPQRSLITDPPPTHIDTPLPAHTSCMLAYLPTILKDYTPCAADPVQNGTFEAGATAWTWEGGAIPFNSAGHSGTYTARLGGDNGVNQRVYQTITIPSTNPMGHSLQAAYLHFFWYIATDEMIHPYDYLFINVRTPSGTHRERLDQLSDADAFRGWGSSSLDLTAYIGQTIQIAFEGVTDGTRVTSFYLDDVSILACGS